MLKVKRPCQKKAKKQKFETLDIEEFNIGVENVAGETARCFLPSILYMQNF